MAQVIAFNYARRLGGGPLLFRREPPWIRRAAMSM
jgi:hypothetical protein